LPRIIAIHKVDVHASEIVFNLNHDYSVKRLVERATVQVAGNTLYL
jgi:hypothetical protein